MFDPHAFFHIVFIKKRVLGLNMVQTICIEYIKDKFLNKIMKIILHIGNYTKQASAQLPSEAVDRQLKSPCFLGLPV